MAVKTLTIDGQLVTAAARADRARRPRERGRHRHPDALPSRRRSARSARAVCAWSRSAGQQAPARLPDAGRRGHGRADRTAPAAANIAR